jgi:hypothetical protein
VSTPGQDDRGQFAQNPGRCALGRRVLTASRCDAASAKAEAPRGTGVSPQQRAIWSWTQIFGLGGRIDGSRSILTILILAHVAIALDSHTPELEARFLLRGRSSPQWLGSEGDSFIAAWQ